MKLSKEIRYGTRAMVEVASFYPEGTISAKEVAQRQLLSVKFLEQILRTLKAAGLLKASRGIYGGYMLARSPDAIRLSDIYRALEGDPILVECIDQPKVCPLHEICPTRDVWAEMSMKLVSVLEATTIQDLLNRRTIKTLCQARMYHI
jgi:Rrf2 family protein